MTTEHPLYTLTLNALENDLLQMCEEGHSEVTLRAELEAARAKRSLDALVILQTEWWQRPSPPEFAYAEPSDWDAIAASFPDANASARFAGTDAELADRLHAAWLGRCAGCQLGKPLEGTTWPDKIRTVLEVVGSWPLRDYMNPTPAGFDPAQIPDCDFFQRAHAWRNKLAKGNFDHVAPDDDIHYALTSQRVLEEYGPHFTPQQVLDTIKRVTPHSCLYAAGANMMRTAVFGMTAPATALFGNPCRQSLGAMIRCDAWGWGAPANPALAARMAFTDASCSQTRNGIYAGIFFAVLMADVLAHGDVARAIETAAEYVPPRTRFAEMLELVRAWCSHDVDWQTVNRRILERWPEESKRFNHSIPNAAIVLTGLLLGKGDFTETLGITVMCGLDTDCTGATAGSIMGCALGTRGIPNHWTAPFNDTMRTGLAGMHELRISEVAKRLFNVARQHARR